MTGIQPATKKGSKNLLTHTHNTLTYTDSNTAICNEEMLANPLCVIVEVLNKAICNEEMLANPLCVIVEVLNKAICNEEMLANPLCVIVEVLNNADGCLRMYKSLGFFKATEISNVS